MKACKTINIFKPLLFITILLIPVGCGFFWKSSPSTEEVASQVEEGVSVETIEETQSEPPIEEKTLDPEDVSPPLETTEMESPPIAEEKIETPPRQEVASIPKGGPLHDVVILKNKLKLSPGKLVIKAGETIRWTNEDGQKHFLASVPGSGEGDELEIFSLMEPGIVYEHTFKTAGEFPYFCFIHNQMTGHVTVTR